MEEARWGSVLRAVFVKHRPIKHKYSIIHRFSIHVNDLFFQLRLIINGIRMSRSVTRASKITNAAKDIWVIVAWFGLFSGLVEGFIFITLQFFGQLTGVSIGILWISPLFNIILISLLGLALVIVAPFVSRFMFMGLSIFLFALFTIMDWLMILLRERIENYAILVLAFGLSFVFVRSFRKKEAFFLKFWRVSLPWLAGITLLVLVGIQGWIWLNEKAQISDLPDKATNSPNIVMIVVDTLRADHLSTYGYERPTSPNIDEIAKQGILFENAISTSSNSLPSHASLFTGLYLNEHGVEWDTPKALKYASYPTLAEVLQSKGYLTGGFTANLYWVTQEEGFNRGFIHYEDYFRSVDDMVFRTLYGRILVNLVLQPLGFEDIPARRLASDINRSVIQWLDRMPRKPFYVFINYMDAHDPYLPPQPYRQKFSGSEVPSGILNCGVGRCFPTLTNDELQGEIDAYDGAISYADDQINQLFIHLSDRGLLENTLVIITSDHGEAFNEHGMYLHDNSLYRELIHVPLIFWWPDELKSGIRVSQPVSIAALPATVMDLLPDGEQMIFPIRSLKPLWEDGDNQPGWPEPLSEINGRPWLPEEYPVQSGWIKTIITPDWQYLVNEKLAAELYDWKNDLSESQNLANNPDLSDIITRLQLRLMNLLNH